MAKITSLYHQPLFILKRVALPIKSLSNILKSAKISSHLLLRESSDPLAAAVSQTETELAFNKMCRQQPYNRAGFGTHPSKQDPEKNTAD